MRSSFTSLLLVMLVTGSAVPACAATQEIAPEHQLVYSAAHRLIPLADGSHVLLYDTRGDLETSREALLVSQRGRREDRAFRLSLLIPDELAEGTIGQIRSVAATPDRKWLAMVGGWLGARDRRGHNGVFLLQQEESTHYWRLHSWFDARGVTLGEVEFGPDDTLLVTMHEEQRDGTRGPTLRLYSYLGQTLGDFVSTSDTDENPGAAPLLSRIVRLGPSGYAVYDPASAVVRYLQISAAGRQYLVRQTRTVPIPFPTERANLIAFDPRPSGRIAFARTTVQGGKGGSTVTVVSPDGAVVRESAAPRTWRFGYSDGTAVHGFYATGAEQPIVSAAMPIEPGNE